MYPNDRHDSGIDGDDNSGATLNRTPLRKVVTRTSVCVPQRPSRFSIDGDDSGATLNRTPLRKVVTRTSVCVPQHRDSGIDGDDNSGGATDSNPNDRHDSGIDGVTSGATLNRTPLRKVATRTSVCVPQRPSRFRH